MQLRRIGFAFMLILALVPALSVTQSNVSGQGYVTVTTQTTTTGLYTSITTTLYQTETAPGNVYPSWKNTSLQFTLYACPFGQNSRGAGVRSDQWNAFQGERYHFEWTANSSLGLYVATDPYVLQNAGKYGCVDFPYDHALHLGSGATGSVDWVASGTGPAIAWLWNLNPSQSVSGAWSIKVFVSTTVSSVSEFLASTTEVLLATMISTAVSQVGPPFGNLSLLGAVVAVAVVAGVLVLTRRRKMSVAATLVQERPATLQESPRESVASPSVAQTSEVQSPPLTMRVAGPLTAENSIVRAIPEIRPARTEPTATMVIETPMVVPKPIQRRQLIVSTGYKDLDKALDGGIPEGFAVVVASPSYDERDLLLRKIIESVIANDGSTFYISNDISKTQDLLSRFQSGFFAFSSHAGQISPQGPNLYKIPGIENLSDANISLGIAIRDAKAKAKDSGKLLLIDILSDILLKHKAIMTRRWLSDFVSKRKGERFTVIATLNPLVASREETESVVDFFDGVIEIHERTLTERARRFLLVKKMYGRRYSENELMLDRDKLL